MNLEIDLPEDIASQLAARWGDLSHHALETLAVEAYREGILTDAEVQRMLGHASRWETEAFLSRARAYNEYSEADLGRDIAAIRKADER
jgi:chromosome segregation and condensation protein ScpB